MSRFSLSTFLPIVLALVVATPATAQLAWEQVVGPAASTPAGFGDTDNRFVTSSAILGDYLYAGTFNHMFGSEVWRSSNGTSWTRVNSDGFGGTDAALNSASYSMAEFNGKIYAATWSTGWPSTPSTQTRVFRYESGTTWTQVNDDGFGPNSHSNEPWAMVEFFGQLYIGVANYTDGADVWRSHNGVSWVNVSDEGFGDEHNAEISSLAVFNGFLYAATRNDWTGTEVWRSDGGITWTQVATPATFGGADHIASYTMTEFEGQLYLATFNTISGGTVYRTSNGTDWSLLISTASGFGDANNWGSHAMTVYDEMLYLSTFNWTTGTEVWATGNGINWDQVNENGFGDAGNYNVFTWSELNGTLYGGLRNDGGCQVWRFTSPIFSDGFESDDTSGWSTTVQ